MTSKKLWLTAIFLLPSAFLMGQGNMAQTSGATPADLLKPLKDSWPTYNGDYTGKRYSALTQVNRSTVKQLTLGWMTEVTPGAEGSGGRGGREQTPFVTGGEGPGDIAIRGGSIKASLLAVDGVLYVTTPDNGWAVDARSGRQLWHYFWKTKGGTHIGNRGFGMWNGFLYMETP